MDWREIGVGNSGSWRSAWVADIPKRGGHQSVARRIWCKGNCWDEVCRAVIGDDRDAGGSLTRAGLGDVAPDHTIPKRHTMVWSHLPYLASELRPLLAEILAICALLALLWGGIAFMLETSHDSTAAGAVLAGRNLARAFEESTRRAVSEIDQTLLSVRAFYALQGGRFDINEWVRTQHRADWMTVNLGLADATGNVFTNTTALPPGGANIFDRPHFRIHLTPGRDELYISRPVIGRISGQQTIQFTRKLIGADGQFAGVIVLSIGCDELSRFYGTLDVNTGYIELIDLEGIVLARGPTGTGLIGRDISASPLFQALRASASGLYRGRTSIDGVAQFVDVRRLADYGLAVLVGLDETTVFQPYYLLQRRLIGSGLVASIIMLVCGVVWIRHRRHAVRTRRALDVTLGAISQGILMVDDHGRVPVINQRAIELLDLGSVAGGQNASGITLASLGLADRPDLVIGASVPDRYDRYRNDGAIIEVNSHRLPSGDTVQTFTDVTEQRHAETRIRYQAHHDYLTGLPNRVTLRDRLTELLEQGIQAGRVAAMMLIDLDGFKSVNDTLGHEAGDRLLIEVAQRLSGLARDDVLVTRIGGDEFVILIENAADIEAIQQTAATVLALMAEPSSTVGQQVQIGASIGLAFYPHDGETGAMLLRNADIALYRAKEDGRGCVRCFNRKMVEDLMLRRSLETDLRQALEHSEGSGLELYFQPQFSGTGLHISGFEALTRWNHPTRGFIPPSVFIPIAEESGLIIALGRWVLHSACTEAVRWRPSVRVAINVSPAQLKDDGFAGEVADTLVRTGMPSHLLEVEVTESVLVDDDARALRLMGQLKAQGIGISLDDFGTGYSSLSYLRRFPFDKLKIDRSFIEQLATEQSAQAIMSAILLLGRSLDLEVIAEGIETPQQLAMVHMLGCSEVQGFLVGRPMPADEIAAFLQQRNAPSPTMRAPELADALTS